ncbi:MAG: magnesium/cobalt efflux protein, partial [Arenimonas sp.]
WLEKLSQAFSGEPESLDDLREILDSAAKHGLIDTDTLKRLQGALAVSEMTVSDVMVPRGQMVSLSATDSFLDLMRQVVESGHS